MGGFEGTGRMSEPPRQSVASDGFHQTTVEYTSENGKCQTMKGNSMEDSLDLVKGGCGHSAKELEDSALVCTICFIILAAILIVSAIVA